MTSPSRPAATVIVLRPGAGGLQLLMLKRSRKAGFFPSAWVFPGGRVDASDSLVPVKSAEPLSDQETAALVAAHRECLEEAGVWIGEGKADPQLRSLLNQRQAVLPDDGSLLVDAQRARLWSRWITPDTEPKRYDTWFFVCILTEEEGALALQDGIQDGFETVELRWLSVPAAISAHEAGEMFMAPPTYITLLELSCFTTADALWSAALERDVRPLQPTHVRDESGLTILFPGHSLHPVTEARSDFAGVRLEEGVWRLL